MRQMVYLGWIRATLSHSLLVNPTKIRSVFKQRGHVEILAQ